MSSIFRLVTETDAENPVLHDLQIASGKTVFLDESSEMIRQRIHCRLSWVRGEWYQDQLQGVPWFESLFVTRPSTERIVRIIREALLATQGVASVLSLAVEISGREAYVSFEISTVAGHLIEVVDTPYVVAP